MESDTTTSVPLVDLKAQYHAIKPEIDEAVQRVIEDADFILGAELDAFEQEFADFCGVNHAVGCGSGTEALRLAHMALDIGQGDEVILPAMTYLATALAVTLCGAHPVLVDVDEQSALIDPEAVERAITAKTRAIVPVHLFGQCADMKAIIDIARRHDLYVVEDAAQSHGAHFGGVKAGALGDVGCFSFYPGKNLGAYGDGGLVTTQDGGIADKIRLLRNLGSRKKYEHEVIGTNSRLDTIQAAVLRVKLRHLDEWNLARRWHAAAYDRCLDSLPRIRRTRYGPGSNYHLYVIRTEHRDSKLSALNAAAIGASIHYPAAVHELPAFQWLGHSAGSFPISESWARTCLSLPIYAELPEWAPCHATAVLKASC